MCAYVIVVALHIPRGRRGKDAHSLVCKCPQAIVVNGTALIQRDTRGHAHLHEDARIVYMWLLRGGARGRTTRIGERPARFELHFAFRACRVGVINEVARAINKSYKINTTIWR